MIHRHWDQDERVKKSKETKRIEILAKIVRHKTYQKRG